jgi:HPt (histidine-containing phosphotransfer) domain-containing protein
MDGYLSKPIRTVEPAGEIARVIAAHPPTASAPDVAQATHPGRAVQAIEAIDAREFLARLGGNSELLCEVIDMYLNEYPTRLTTLREALVRQDWPAIQQTAHTMKGTAASIAAEPAYQIATSVERAANAADADSVAAALSALEQELQRLAQALLALKARQHDEMIEQ